MENNYVIFWRKWDLYEQSFSDLKDKPYARFINTPTFYMHGAKKHIYEVQHRHPRVNRKMESFFGNLWLKPNYWYPSYFVNDFDNDKELVFIFDTEWVQGEFANYVSFLKHNYPEAKFVLICTDLWHTLGVNDVEKTKADFDLVLSFDQNDCNKYNFIYHPLVFSPFHGKIDDMPDYDVFFLGQPKNRLPEIMACLEKLWENDVKTDVHLVKVDSNEQIYKDRIDYVDEVIPYKTNLQHFLHANCALEIMQHGGVGYTQRMCEAIAFGKKIITNNKLIHEAPFYNPNYIFQIKSATDITPELCEQIKRREHVDYHYTEQISPIELLRFIEKKLS